MSVGIAALSCTTLFISDAISSFVVAHFSMKDKSTALGDLVSVSGGIRVGAVDIGACTAVLYFFDVVLYNDVSAVRLLVEVKKQLLTKM